MPSVSHPVLDEFRRMQCSHLHVYGLWPHTVLVAHDVYNLFLQALQEVFGEVQLQPLDGGRSGVVFEGTLYISE